MSFSSKATERTRFNVNVQRVNASDASTLLRAPKQKKSQKIFSRLYALVMALTIVTVSMLAGMGGSKPAQANPFDFQNDICTAGLWYYDLEKRSLPPDTRNANGLENRDGIGSNGNTKTATAYERYGMAGTQWTVWSGPQNNDDGLKGEGKYQGKSIVSFMGGDLNDNKITANKIDPLKYPGFYNTSKECFPAGNIVVTGIANAALSGAKLVVHISNFVFQVAYDGSSSVVEKLTPSITSIIGGLYEKLYLEPVLIIGMLASIAILIQGIFKKQFTQAFQSAVWFAFALLLGFFMKLNPMLIHTVSDYVVKTGTEITITALMAGTTNSQTGEKDQLGKLCEIKKNPGEGSSISTVRTLQCTLWYSFVYTPWVMGQFGDEPGKGNAFKANSNDMGIDESKTGLGIGSKGKNANQNPDMTNISFNGRTFKGDWSIYWLDNKVIKTDNHDKFGSDARQVQQTNLISTTVSQLHTNNPNYDFKGNNAGSRLTYASMSLIASLASGFMVVLLSFSLIIMELGTMILIILSPVFLLVAAHPTVGRRIFMGYLETLINLAISRIVISMILGLMVTLFSAVINVSSSLGWLLSLIMVVAISIAGIQYRQQIIDMFAKVSFGSGGAGIKTQPLPGMNKAKSVVGGVVGGAAVVGAAKGIKNKVAANKQQKRADNTAAATELRNRRDGGTGTGTGGKPDKVTPSKKPLLGNNSNNNNDEGDSTTTSSDSPIIGGGGGSEKIEPISNREELSEENIGENSEELGNGRVPNKVEPEFVRREREKLEKMEKPASSRKLDPNSPLNPKNPNSPIHMKKRTQLESIHGVGNVSYEDVIRELGSESNIKSGQKKLKAFTKQEKRVDAANKRMDRAIAGKTRIETRRSNLNEAYSQLKDSASNGKKRATELTKKPVKKITQGVNNSKFNVAIKDRHEAGVMKGGAYSKAISGSKRVNDSVVAKKNSIKTERQSNKEWKSDQKELVKGYKRERRLTKQGKPLPPKNSAPKNSAPRVSPPKNSAPRVSPPKKQIK